MNVIGLGKLSEEEGADLLRLLQRWIRGDGVGGTPRIDVAVVENAGDAATLATVPGVVTSKTLLLVPGRVSVERAQAWCVGYSGSAAAPGEELVIDDTFFVQIQDYVSSAFLPIAGPAVVRVVSDADYAAFIDDADIARATGIFPEHLVNPLVQLGDQCALGSGGACGAPSLRRLHVSEFGEVRSAPGGAALGSVTSADPQAWVAEARRILGAGEDPCLAGVVTRDLVREARAARPWLSRYLWSLEGLRQLAARGVHGARVSGFGGRLVDAVGSLGIGRETESPGAPVLLTTDTDAYVFLPAGERMFKVGADAARLAEIAGLAPSGDVARQAAAAHLGVPLDVASAAIDDVTARFFAYGVDVVGTGVGVG